MPANPTILVVEDNNDVIEIISEFLTAYGFEVLQAKDGQEAIELFNRKKPDIVLADVLLPKINGFQVCQTIKNSSSPVPVILMSALYKTYNLQQQAKTKYGADDYIIKPVDLMDLARRLCNLLGIDKPSKIRQSVVEDLANAAAEQAPVETAPATPGIGGIADKGELKNVPIEQVIGWFVRSNRTGRLAIAVGDVIRTVYLRDGMPIFVQSPVAEETFSHLLLEDGKLTTAQLADAEVAAKTTKKTLGKVLVENGTINQAELAAYLLKETNDRLLAVFRLNDGIYEFTDDRSFLEKIKRPDMEVFDLAYQAICRQVSESRLRGRFERREKLTVEKNEDLLHLAGRIAWEHKHLDVFILIDGERSVAQLISQSDNVPVVVWQLLYTLEIFDIVRFR